MAVENISYVAIMVKDLEQAAKDYSDLLGIEFPEPHESQAIDMRVTRSPVGIELVAPLSPDGALAKTIERRGEGMMLVTLWVSDLQEASAQLKAKGARQVGGDGVKSIILHPRDFHGVMVELDQSDS